MKLGSVRVLGTLDTGDKTWVRVYGTSLLASASSVSITGLNGNIDTEYILIGRIVSGQANCNYGVRPNNQSDAATYGYQNLVGVSSSATAVRDTSSYLLLASSGDNDADTLVQSKMQIYVSAGYVRAGLVETSEKITGTTVTQDGLFGVVHNDTSSNYTSLVVVSSVSGGLGIGTSIELYTLR